MERSVGELVSENVMGVLPQALTGAEIMMAGNRVIKRGLRDAFRSRLIGNPDRFRGRLPLVSHPWHDAIVRQLQVRVAFAGAEGKGGKTTEGGFR